MKILIANLGSTSMKYRLFSFDGDQETLLAKGGLERVDDYRSAISTCLEELKESGALPSVRELAAVGFKTVTAKGTSGCVELDDDVLATMEAYNKVAPAHNPTYMRVFSGFGLGPRPADGSSKQPLSVDSRFNLAIAFPRAGTSGRQAPGFHGASHKFIAEGPLNFFSETLSRNSQPLCRWPTDTSGRGPLRVAPAFESSSSITGIQNGVAIGNSMGLSPQSVSP